MAQLEMKIAVDRSEVDALLRDVRNAAPVSRADFDNLVLAVAGLCDAVKRLELAAQASPGFSAEYACLASEKRASAEGYIDRITVVREGLSDGER